MTKTPEFQEIHPELQPFDILLQEFQKMGITSTWVLKAIDPNAKQACINAMHEWHRYRTAQDKKHSKRKRYD